MLVSPALCCISFHSINTIIKIVVVVVIIVYMRLTFFYLSLFLYSFLSFSISSFFSSLFLSSIYPSFLSFILFLIFLYRCPLISIFQLSLRSFCRSFLSFNSFFFSFLLLHNHFLPYLHFQISSLFFHVKTGHFTIDKPFAMFIVLYVLSPL